MSGEDAACDLSGNWTGLYNYPIELPPTMFEATIRDTDGLITGVTAEKGDMFERPGETLHAMIEGFRDGSSVRFVKVYDELTDAADTVHYQGTVLPGGDEIDGKWEIPGDWSGTFLMVRAQGTEASVALNASEKV